MHGRDVRFTSSGVMVFFFFFCAVACVVLGRVRRAEGAPGIPSALIDMHRFGLRGLSGLSSCDALNSVCRLSRLAEIIVQHAGEGNLWGPHRARRLLAWPYSSSI